MTRSRTIAVAALATALVALSLLAGVSRGSGRPAPPPPSDRRVAGNAIEQYAAYLDAGRGTAFCNNAISAVTLEVEGGADHCVATIDSYVRTVEKRGYQVALQSMHYLFTMLSDGINGHCTAGRSCPAASYGRWASDTYPGEVDWRTGTNPGLASSMGSKVVAVVDPLASSTRRITLYYQAWDGRIFRASWSTKTGGWYGTVVDTHRGSPFLSHIRVLSAERSGNRISARVSMRVGTRPMTEQFVLVHEAGSWRVDTWRPVTGPPSV